MAHHQCRRQGGHVAVKMWWSGGGVKTWSVVPAEWRVVMPHDLRPFHLTYLYQSTLLSFFFYIQLIQYNVRSLSLVTSPNFHRASNIFFLSLRKVHKDRFQDGSVVRPFRPKPFHGMHLNSLRKLIFFLAALGLDGE